MCRILFLRKYHKTVYNYQYDYNHPGLEISPILCNDIKDENYAEGYVGMQCKYCDTNDNNTVYKEIKKSLDAVKKYYLQGDKKTDLKQIYIYTNAKFQNEYFSKETLPEDTLIPVLIKLRECINGNLESLINEKQTFYNLNFTKSKFKYIYFLDGFDELSYKDIGNVLFTIANLESLKSTDKIIISSRMGSKNLLLFRERIKSAEYVIQNLSQEDIKMYFQIKENDFKIECYKKIEEKKAEIISEINDVFTLNLFWNNIEGMDTSNMDNYLYFKTKIQNEPIEKLYDKQIKNLKCENNHMKHLYFSGSTNLDTRLVHAFYKYISDNNIDFLIKIVDEITEEHLEVLCYEIIDKDNIIFLVGDEANYVQARNSIINRIEKGLLNNYLNTVVFYNFLCNKKLEIEKIKEAFKEKNVKRYIEWEEGFNTNKLMAIILNDPKLYHDHYKIDVEFLKAIQLNLNDKHNILLSRIEIIQKYNYKTDNFFIYTHSNELGKYISYLNFELDGLKDFLKKLKNYPSIVSIQAVYYTIFKNSLDLFKKVCNKSILKSITDKKRSLQTEYLDEAESDFQITVDKQLYHEQWATNFHDKKAYISDYIIYFNDKEIEKISLVCVDGFRATLPVTQINSIKVKREHYYFARLFNNSQEELRSYLNFSGLIIE